MDAQPKIGGFGCFKGVLQIPFFLLMQFHKAIFYFNPKMGHMLNLAIVDKLNRVRGSSWRVYKALLITTASQARSAVNT